MSINVQGFVNQQKMEVGVYGPDGANRLLIYTGTVKFNLKGNDGAWNHDILSFRVGPQLSHNQFIRAIASASLAKLYNVSTADNAGWYIDNVDADWDDESGYVELRANIGCSDSDGYLYEVAYRVDVLAQMPEPQAVKKPLERAKKSTEAESTTTID
jgi:hypothetical protein